MAAAAREDEKVPDKVTVAFLCGRQKRDPHHVRDPTRQQPEQTRERHTQPQRSNRDQDQPPHAEVDTHREPWVADAAHRYQNYAECRETPDESEQRPAPGATQHAERERRVGAGDQQEDRSVVEHPE